MREAIKGTQLFGYDVTLPTYFRKNPFISRVSSKIEPLVRAYERALRAVLNRFKRTTNDKWTVLPMLDSMKHSLIGRVHDPHPRFMEVGSHAITLKTHAPDDTIKEDRRVRAMIWVMEKLVRIHDQLDEQLHAGDYFYILTASGKFICNTQFIWPIVLAFFGLNLNPFLDYFTHEAMKEKRAEEKGGVQEKDYSRALAMLFAAISYYLGYLMTLMPRIYLNFVRPWYEPLAETEQRNLLTLQAGHIICSADHDYYSML